MERYTMTKKEIERCQVINMCLKGLLTVREAAEILHLSERQIYRLKAGVKEHGVAFIIHKNRGRKPSHALTKETQEKVVKLAIEKYPGANYSHLTDMLRECEHISISVSSTRRVLRKAGIPSSKKRRSPKQHRLRKRKPSEGALVQIDASLHAWLEDRAPQFALHGAIDDATGKVLGAVFKETETLDGYLMVLRQIVESHGIPCALYADRHTIFRSPDAAKLTLEDELNGIQVKPTQFGQALQQLGIGHIDASSPQAKGRIERLWQTFQDRLIKEMSWADISTLEEAQAFLVDFVPRYNQRFAVEPASSQSAFRPVPKELDLTYVLCRREQRKILSGCSVAFKNCHLQPMLNHQPAYLPKGAVVEVLIPLDGPLKLAYKGVLYDIKELPQRAKPEGTSSPDVKTKQERKPHKPSPNHPWRRSYKLPPLPYAASEVAASHDAL
jgi:transposase